MSASKVEPRCVLCGDLRTRVAELEAALRGLMDHACLCYRGTCAQCEAVRKLVEVRP